MQAIAAVPQAKLPCWPGWTQKVPAGVAAQHPVGQLDGSQPVDVPPSLVVPPTQVPLVQFVPREQVAQVRPPLPQVRFDCDEGGMQRGIPAVCWQQPAQLIGPQAGGVWQVPLMQSWPR